MNARRLVAIAIIVVTAAASCGLPARNHVTTVDSTSVPFGLLRPTPVSSANAGPGGHPVHIFLIEGTRLVAADRRVLSANVPSSTVRVLFLGPLPAETKHGLTSDIPAQTHLVSLDLKGTTATLDLTGEFGTVGGTAQVLAVAQIVYTLTAFQYIHSVRIEINGKPVEAPNGSGSLSYAARSRSDYHSVAPSQSASPSAG